MSRGGANGPDHDIARSDRAVDRLPWGKEAAEVMAGFW